MGRVYLAADSRLNRRVAVKILSPERVNNPRAIARFHREALVGAQLQHENLVRIYDEGESAGKCYLVMEYIEGKNIGQMIAEAGPIPPAVAARLGRQVALGLEHAQRKGLIHRDVNPYNILVTRDGTAKLTDLGLAIDLADQDRVTRDGATVGTFDYVSPEQARHSHSVDTRSDIYSLGCTLYHMLTGQVPFPSASLPEKLFSHQAVDPEPVTKLVPDVPEGLAAVVARMMRKSPDDRYATPLELAQALEPFADVAPGPDSGSTPAPGRARVAARGERHGGHRPRRATATRRPVPAPAAPPVVAGGAVLWDVPAAVVEATLGTPASTDAVLGFDLGVNLGPEAPLSQKATPTEPTPAPSRRPKPEPKPKPPRPTRPPRPRRHPAFWEAPACRARPRTHPSGNDDGLGFDLGVNLGPEAPLREGRRRPRRRSPNPNPSPSRRRPRLRRLHRVGRAPASGTPARRQDRRRRPSPEAGALGFDLGVNLGRAAARAEEPTRRRPQSRSPNQPKAKPVPAPAPPRTAACPAPAPARILGTAAVETRGAAPPPRKAALLGLDLGVNLGPGAPARAERADRRPEVQARTQGRSPKPAPTPTPPPTPAPAPDPGPAGDRRPRPRPRPAARSGHRLLGLNLGAGPAAAAGRSRQPARRNRSRSPRRRRRRRTRPRPSSSPPRHPRPRRPGARTR